jgi:hypothetical protein
MALMMAKRAMVSLSDPQSGHPTQLLPDEPTH